MLLTKFDFMIYTASLWKSLHQFQVGKLETDNSFIPWGQKKNLSARWLEKSLIIIITTANANNVFLVI